MRQRKINLLMVLCSLVGGGIGYAVGEILLANFSGEWPTWLLMGLYFGQYAFFVGLMCLVAEMVSPRLNGQGWKQRYVGASWKMLVPSTFLMIGVVAMLLQFAYGATFQTTSGSDNIVMLLDTSGSMKRSDPNNQLFPAAGDMVQKMEQGTNVAVISFNDRSEVVQPLIQLDSQTVKDEVVQKLLQQAGTSGGTNIEEALRTALEHLQTSQKWNHSTIVLMSDGYSRVDLESALAPFKQANIVIHTVGMSAVDAEGTNLLKQISANTGGSYFDVEHADQITGVFGQIIELTRQERTLVSDRSDATESSDLYASLRVLSMVIIGTLLGLALGLIFDNRHLAKSFIVGGAISGLLAGLVLESGFSSGDWPEMLLRLLATLLMAVVVALFTLLIPVAVNQGSSSFQARLSRSKALPVRSGDAGKQNSKRFDL
ncbi:vWA domain-containing protein [Brevibacillus invocatus]|uniref:vWA domain-containing protein n=1 Tax=Brevibacillus invocatus TaxID=173959 RepID=UPI00203D6031|nr:vWA domain-containing protein [Brevibacillus invocatus]MCM3077695.1 VWA domain-containing protein [Brevibacillus invocatus]MCM3428697.1 VWA domain-containing protein [Brevibacillus invocatus]